MKLHGDIKNGNRRSENRRNGRPHGEHGMGRRYSGKRRKEDVSEMEGTHIGKDRRKGYSQSARQPQDVVNGGKETREQGSQTDDIRKEARTLRPEEIESPIRQKQMIRRRNGWKKKQEETSRKMKKMNVEGRLLVMRNWKPTPVLDFLIDTGASKSLVTSIIGNISEM